MIADDEMIECRGLERMIQNGFCDIELLPSVYNGVELIQCVEKEKPDIVIVDLNMPGLSGLEAVEILRMKSYETKVIINTAYSEFEYIKKALILGASDYLQKPIEEEKFREALSRVIQSIEKEKVKNRCEENSSKQIKKIRKVAEAEIMSSILLGKPNEEGLSILFENLSGDYFGGLMVAVMPRDRRTLHVDFQSLSEKMGSFLRNYCTCMTRVNKDILYLLLIPGKQVHGNEYQEWVGALLGKIIKSELQVQLKFGISSWKYEFEKMTEAYHECQIAVRISDGEDIRFFEEAKDNKDKGQLGKKEKALVELAKEKEWDRFQAYLDQIYQEYDFTEETIRLLKIWSAKLVYQCKLYLEFEESLYGFWGKGEVWRILKTCNSSEELLNAVMGFVKEKKRHIVEDDIRNEYTNQAMLYMEKNYMKDISLEQVAGYVGISSFYLSRLLKHQTYKNFVELLTDIRMEHAVKLIEKEDFTVKDIGSRVGYQSPTYFYKVFKKNTGMTVGEMREILRK